MLRKPHIRRPLAIMLAVAGAIMMFIAPEETWAGVLLLAVGVMIEVICIALKRGD